MIMYRHIPRGTSNRNDLFNFRFKPSKVMNGYIVPNVCLYDYRRGSLIFAVTASKVYSLYFVSFNLCETQTLTNHLSWIPWIHVTVNEL